MPTVKAEDTGAAATRSHQAHELVDGRRLASPVGPEKAEYLPLLHREGKVPDAMSLAVVTRKPFDVYWEASHYRAPCRSSMWLRLYPKTAKLSNTWAQAN